MVQIQPNNPLDNPSRWKTAAIPSLVGVGTVQQIGAAAIVPSDRDQPLALLREGNHSLGAILWKCRPPSPLARNRLKLSPASHLTRTGSLITQLCPKR